jgi:hypothetical protein
MNDYSEKFGLRVLGILQEYGAKGFPVTMMVRQAEYGSMPNGICFQLRAFASRLNEDGTVKQ